MSNIPPRKFRNYRFGYGVNRPIPLLDIIARQNELAEISTDNTVVVLGPPYILASDITYIGPRVATTVKLYGSGLTEDTELYAVGIHTPLVGTVQIGDSDRSGVKLNYNLLSTTELEVDLNIVDANVLDMIVVNEEGLRSWKDKLGSNFNGIVVGDYRARFNLNQAGEDDRNIPGINYTASASGRLINLTKIPLGINNEEISYTITAGGKLVSTSISEVNTNLMDMFGSGYVPLGITTKIVANGRLVPITIVPEISLDVVNITYQITASGRLLDATTLVEVFYEI